MLVLKLILLLPVLVAALDEDDIENCVDGHGYRTCTPSFPVPADKTVTVTVRYYTISKTLKSIEVAEGGRIIITASLEGANISRQVCERPSGNHICLHYNKVQVSSGTDICYMISTSANTIYSSGRCDNISSKGIQYIPTGSNLPK
ncbi:uncharacterized protein [Rhodnius prolixus]|uniref:uncharacterized protein n=1 Tax=Rhodnius prolixus TaxID=13249 RepID=UPI003D18BF7F